MRLEIVRSRVVLNAPTNETRTSNPHSSQMAMMSRLEKSVAPPTPSTVFTPNIDASFEPTEVRDVHALEITMKTT